MLCKQVFPSAAYLCRAFKAWPGLAWSSWSCPSAPLPGFTRLLHPGGRLELSGIAPSDLRQERDWHASRSGAGGASCPPRLLLSAGAHRGASAGCVQTRFRCTCSHPPAPEPRGRPATSLRASTSASMTVCPPSCHRHMGGKVSSVARGFGSGV